MRRIPLGVAASLLLLFTASLAWCEPQNGGAAIAIQSGGIRVPIMVAPQPDSGALVVLEDTRNANIDVYSQRLDRRGRPTLGMGGTLIWSSPIGAQLSAIAPDGAGSIVFVWTVNGGASGQDIMVERVLPNGTLAYPLPGVVVCNAPGTQQYPAVVTGAGGSFWVTWSDQRSGIVGQADVYAQRFNAAGVPQLAANGILVNTPAFAMPSYGSPYAASDLSGGLLLSWNVNSPGGVRAQRVGPAGALQFGATGAPLGDPADYYVNIVPDGTGGLWGTVMRGDTPYAMHLNASGAATIAPSGVALHSGNTPGFDLHAVRDASGGCFIYGLVNSSSPMGRPFIFRQQVSSTGSLLRGSDGETYGYNATSMYLFDTGSDVVTVVQEYPNIEGWQNRLQRWGYDGTPAYPGTGVVVGRAAPNYGLTAVTAAGAANHVIFEAQADPRYNTPARTYNYQAFGQAFDASGNPLWTDAENPSLVSAKDAPADQGGFVRVTFDASAADNPGARTAVGYHGWRSLELSLTASLAARFPNASGEFVDHGRHYLAALGQYWEQVASAPASQLASYALSLPTGQDSTGSGAANEAFMVEAYDDSLHHWYSSPLTSHSVDNLPPSVPAPFTGTYVAGTTYMLWHTNSEADLAGYRLYRGSSAGFTPGPGNLVAALSSPGFDDHAGFPAFYKLSAVDIHGNESPFALLLPSGTTAVDDATPKEVAFALGSASPAHGSATLRLALPVAAHARVAIYDAGGREVRLLANGDQAAGTYALQWNGTDAAGQRAPSGLYFARLDTAGRTFTRRVVLMR